MYSSPCRFFLDVLFILPFVTSISEQISKVRIYQNVAETIQPLEKLPLQFTVDEWNNIVPQTLTLLGENLTVTSQRITTMKKSLNGVQVYIRSPLSKDKTNIGLIKATLVDENQHVVKVKDKSISDQVLYFTVSPQDIFYLDEPTDPKIQVDFTYNTSNSKVYVRCWRRDLIWEAQYQLTMDGDRTDLIVTANIRNNGSSSISINQTKLIGQNVELWAHSQQSFGYGRSQLQSVNDNSVHPRYSPKFRPPPPFDIQALSRSYEFSINRPLVIDAQTNYLLPMLRLKVRIEQYNLVSGSGPMQPISATQTPVRSAQRRYRLTSDRSLSQGNCILQEHDRVLGEIYLPDIPAEEKYEFSIGEYSDVLYAQNITNVTDTPLEHPTRADQKYTDYGPIFCVYEIAIQLKNLRSHSVQVEYTKPLFSGRLILMQSTDNHCRQDDSWIKCKFTLNSHAQAVYSYRFQSRC